MKSTTAKALLLVTVFYGFVGCVYIILHQFVHDISGVAPDALHLVGFVALLPLISATGGRWAERKLNYIKNNSLFPAVIWAIFIVTSISLIPWILTFLIADNAWLLYVDWAAVLANLAVSFVVFALFLRIFI